MQESGSSRKVRLRQRDKTNKKEEEFIIPIAIAHTFSHLDFIIEAFKLTRTDGEGSMCDKPGNMLFLQISKMNKRINSTFFCSLESCFPGCFCFGGITEGEQTAQLFLHGITDRKV